MCPAIPNRPATRKLQGVRVYGGGTARGGVGMRGVPEFSLDGWDLLTRGLSDEPSQTQPSGNALTAQ